MGRQEGPPPPPPPAVPLLPMPTSATLLRPSSVLLTLDDTGTSPFAACQGAPQPAHQQQNASAARGEEGAGETISAGSSHQPLSPTSAARDERARRQKDRRDALLDAFSAEWLERGEDRPQKQVLLDGEARVPVSLGVHVMSVQVRNLAIGLLAPGCRAPPTHTHTLPPTVHTMCACLGHQP